MPRFQWGIFIFMAGYSEKPLLKKLGLKDGTKAFIFESPPDYYDWLSPLPKDVVISEKLSGEFDFVHAFVHDSKVFQKEFNRWKQHLKKDGMLWISWPKKSSKIATDLDENSIRDFGLQHGLVDVKVCAVSEIFSGLKFVFRLKDRR